MYDAHARTRAKIGLIKQSVCVCCVRACLRFRLARERLARQTNTHKHNTDQISTTACVPPKIYVHAFCVCFVRVHSHM